MPAGALLAMLRLEIRQHTVLPQQSSVTRGNLATETDNVMQIVRWRGLIIHCIIIT